MIVKMYVPEVLATEATLNKNRTDIPAHQRCTTVFAGGPISDVLNIFAGLSKFVYTQSGGSIAMLSN